MHVHVHVHGHLRRRGDEVEEQVDVKGGEEQVVDEDGDQVEADEREVIALEADHRGVGLEVLLAVVAVGADEELGRLGDGHVHVSCACVMGMCM